MLTLSNGQILRVCVFALLGLGCVGGIIAVALSDVRMKELFFVFLGVGAFFFFGDAVRVVFDAAEVAQNKRAAAWSGSGPETEAEARRRSDEQQAGVGISNAGSRASSAEAPLLALS